MQAVPKHESVIMGYSAHLGEGKLGAIVLLAFWQLTLYAEASQRNQMMLTTRVHSHSEKIPQSITRFTGNS